MPTVNNNTPTLRFPEFKEEWELKKLGKMAEFKAGYAFKSELMLSEKNNYQLLKMSNVYQNELRLDRNSSYWENIDIKQKEFLLKSGDTILTLTGTVGKQDYGYSVQIKEDNKYLLNQRLVLLRGVNNKSNSDFISYIVSNEKFLYFFFAEAKGGTGNQTNVSTEDVKNIHLNFPTLPEQQKIATFLTAVDEKLQALKQKKSLLEQYKKGVMQKIFSQELRFKDDNGNEFADWEEKKLGEVADFYKGKGLPKSDIVENGKFKCLHYGELFTKYKESIVNILSSTDAFDKPFLSIANDVLMPTSDVTPNGLATASCINEDDVILGGDVLVIRQKIKVFEGLFFSYYVNQYREKVMKLVSGSTVFHLYGSDMKKLEIQLPCLEEQTKIATFLSTIDEKINRCQAQITNTEVWKKGLLQGMFV